MPNRLSRLMVLVAVLVAAFNTVPAGAATPRHSAEAAATPVQAVSSLVRLQQPCWLHWSPPTTQPRMSPSFFRTCAITPRLQQHLLQSGAGWDAFCACPAQLGSPDVSRVQVTPAANNGRVARVDTRWFFGAIWYDTTYVVLYRQHGWLVDDHYCTGHPETSIYRPTAGLCQATIPASFYPQGKASAIRAVSAVTRPFTAKTAGTCVPESGMVYTCPLSLRLLRAVLNRSASSAFCRCQNPPSRVVVTPADNNGRVAHVNARWYFGPTAFATVFVVLHERTGWLVDNQYCAGRPGTTTYGHPRFPPTCR